MRWRRGRDREGEGVSHAPLDAVAGVDRPLGRDLLRCPLAKEPAFAGVGALGVLPNDHEVETVAGKRTQVDVLVEGKTEPKDDAPLDGAPRDAGLADGWTEGALEDRIAGADGGKVVVVEDVAIAQKPICAQVEGRRLDVDTGGPQHVDGRADDRRPDAVAGDDADLVGGGHDEKGSPGTKKPPPRAARCTHQERCVRYRITISDGAEVIAFEDSLFRMTQSHLSRETYERLSSELEQLTTVGRTAIAQAIEAARNLGDLSENGDYHAAKDEQGRMEGRIRQLQAMLEDAQIVEEGGPTDAARPGVTISLRYEGDDDVERYYLGSIEERQQGIEIISTSSPLGLALLDGAKKGDTVEYQTPTGARIRVEIVDVER